MNDMLIDDGIIIFQVGINQAVRLLSLFTGSRRKGLRSIENE